MSEVKTKPTQQKAEDFLNTVEPEEKRRDCFEILAMMEKISGEKAVIWGTSIVGFGVWHFKSERSSQEGDWPLIAFSPRKQNLTLYLMLGNKDSQALLKKLGKYKMSKACLYLKRLSDVDKDTLVKLVEKSYYLAKEKYK